jgi:hypothetical protein
MASGRGDCASRKKQPDLNATLPIVAIRTTRQPVTEQQEYKVSNGSPPGQNGRVKNGE